MKLKNSWTSFENLLYKRLTFKVFLLVSFFVISLPILFNFNYLFFGRKADGLVSGIYTVESRRSNYTVSQIDYKVGDRRFSFMGPRNLIFEEGEMVEIYYIQNDPQSATLASPFYFYFSSSSINIFCTIFIIFWLALFFTYGIRYT